MVVIVVVTCHVDLSCGRRSHTHYSSTPPRLVRSGCRAHGSFLVELVFACYVHCTSRVHVDVRVRELELLEIRGLSRHRPGPVRPDSSRARAPSPRSDLRSTPSFLVHVIHDLVLPRDVLHLNLVFVRTCPPDFFCVGVSRREAVILHGTSCAVIVPGIRIVSRLCSHRMHTLFLVLQSWPSSRPCSPRPRLGTLLSPAVCNCFGLHASARSR